MWMCMCMSMFHFAPVHQGPSTLQYGLVPCAPGQKIRVVENICHEVRNKTDRLGGRSSLGC